MGKGDELLGKTNRWKWFLCKARFALDNKVGGYHCRSQVPEHEILKVVRMYVPIITEFFDNEAETILSIGSQQRASPLVFI